MTDAAAPAGDEPAGRAVPYACPFCADEDLHPVSEGWHCRSCLRVFSLTFHGLRRPETAATESTP